MSLSLFELANIVAYGEHLTTPACKFSVSENAFRELGVPLFEDDLAAVAVRFPFDIDLAMVELLEHWRVAGYLDQPSSDKFIKA